MLDFSKLDWPVVLGAFKIHEQFLSKDHGPCPICTTPKKGGLRRFRFDNKNNMGTWFCSSCGAGNGLTLIRKFTGLSDAAILKEIEETCRDPSIKMNDAPMLVRALESELSEREIATNREKLVRVWTTSVARTDDDVLTKYLRKRVPHCDTSLLTKDIRFHRGLGFYERDGDGFRCMGKFPTMLARVVDGSGKPVTLHRTYLTKNAEKAPFDNAKKQMGGIRKLKGAAIRLNDVPDSRILGATEGLETGLAVMTGYRNKINVWAFLNCGNLAVADIPRDRFDKVIIFADHDSPDEKTGVSPGQHHAEMAMAKLKNEGFEVEIRQPEAEKTDFADVWLDICSKRN